MRSSARKRLSGLLAVNLLVLGASPVLAEDEHWRLFVAEHGDPVVHAIDLESDAAVGRFDIKAPASLYKSHSNRTVFAVQGDANLVTALGSGVEIEDHGDHNDLRVSEPELLKVTATGGKPSHFVEHDGRIAIFYDGEGRADIVTERRFLDGAEDQPASIKSAAPHHGLAAPLGDHVLISVPNPEDPSKRPIGLRVVDSAGEQVGPVHDCPGLHGEATSGDLLAIGCSTGVLVVEPGRGGPVVKHLAYGADLPEGSVSTLKGDTAIQYFLGNFGPGAVVLIDPSEDQAIRLVKLPTRRVDFAVDPVRSEQAYILTEDGRLHTLNILSGSLTASVQLTQPYGMDGHWRDPRPRLAVAGDVIAVTDPLKGLIRVVDTATLKETRTIPVAGRPYNIVAVGGSGASH
ncbi:hypothetical protein N825_25770 [Skermanella stibiiresistens SB22]|uniref:Uncharacterized protein n=1 Tax=Skermanella stibiiresistens SB22 TaxID=1385369 RepID=W9GZ30_9PROT|nr:zinc metallochaperone AztD [Skermanella stibiiresistens]EWY36733.1 hypothetical protein N825_25770 [Skermanella stibiiresistens SB22]